MFLAWFLAHFDAIASSEVTATSTLARVRSALRTVLEGKDEVIDRVLVGVLAGGHVLLEDVPGVGKTTLAKGIARVFDVEFVRVQFTPDLLPGDILGTQILNPREGTFSFHKGPIFTNVLLADEINRASPRTQSALLEAMNESQATIDGVTHRLPQPFFVIATQNPADFSGTYPLPEAQLDRFFLRVTIGYPGHDAEVRMLFGHQRSLPVDAVPRGASKDELLGLQSSVRDVLVKDDVARYIVRIVARTREAPELELGVSPRGALSLFRAAQARAVLQGRDYATPDDVQALAASVLAHRVRLSAQARHAGKTEATFVEGLVRSLEVPT
ncbi:MAG: MoxR family ATPase [Myxococcota bacterium]|nr:MoxR family ATPase [Myxococcota bacterium]